MVTQDKYSVAYLLDLTIYMKWEAKCVMNLKNSGEVRSKQYNCESHLYVTYIRQQEDG